MIEFRLGFPSTYISGDTTRLKQFTALINTALDDYTELAIKSSGKFQFDDTNFTDYPIILTDLKANQRDYAFTSDEDGNLVLAIHRIFARNSSTSPYYELLPKDVQSDSEEEITKFVDGLNSTGSSQYYDKTANGIFLEFLPSGDVTSGLKIYIDREASYFTTADTTKKPGVPGVHHRYFVDKPCYLYAQANNLSGLSQLEKDVIDWEGNERLNVTGRIQNYFCKRAKDERNIMTGKKILYI